MFLTFPWRVSLYTLFISSDQVIGQRWTQSWDTGSDAVAAPALCLSWQKQFPFLTTCSLLILLWTAAVPLSTWKLPISLKNPLLKLYRLIYNWMGIYFCIKIPTSKCESKGNWCTTCKFHRICSAAKLGWSQWEKAWVVNSEKKQKFWYILLNQFSHCLVLTLRKVFELWKYRSCKISMCQWRNNKKLLKLSQLRKLPHVVNIFTKKPLDLFWVIGIKKHCLKGAHRAAVHCAAFRQQWLGKNPTPASQQGVLHTS